MDINTISQSGALVWIAATLTWLFIGIGFLGIFLPAIPGCGLIALAVLLYKLLMPISGLSWTFVICALIAASFAMVMDYLAFIWGAKRWGASGWGLAGAIIGVVVGIIIFTPFIGLIIGPLLGAIIGECLGGQSFRQAMKSGIGTVIGGLIAFIIRFAVAIGIIVGFLIQASRELPMPC